MTVQASFTICGNFATSDLDGPPFDGTFDMILGFTHEAAGHLGSVPGVAHNVCLEPKKAEQTRIEMRFANLPADEQRYKIVSDCEQIFKKNLRVKGFPIVTIV